MRSAKDRKAESCPVDAFNEGIIMLLTVPWQNGMHSVKDVRTKSRSLYESTQHLMPLPTGKYGEVF